MFKTVLLFLLTMVANQDTQVQAPDFSGVDYVAVSYQTGALPPQYAYSYTVVVTPDSAVYTREQAGQTTRHAEAITAEQFQAVVDAFRLMNLRENECEGPAPLGGGRYQVSLFRGDDCVVGGYIYSSGYGTIRMDGRPEGPVLPFIK